MNRVSKALHDRGLSQRECNRHSPPIEPEYQDWNRGEVLVAIAVFAVLVVWMVL